MTQEQIYRVFADAYARRAMHVINIVTPRKPPTGVLAPMEYELDHARD